MVLQGEICEFGFLLTALKNLAKALRCLRFSPCEQKK